MGEVVVGGRARGLTAARVERLVAGVLRAEDREAELSVSFVGLATMRALNREHKGKDRATDVLAFSLPQPGQGIVGDIYVCPAVAREQARELGISPQLELARLVVHGVLHVLGHDHPDGPERERSPMWRRQEEYLRQLA
ncbi:MAG TPA: rRNA maturation RNase YbeY [Gemmatimonadales bacterium]|nr:rRNA maturation RNase YbeY [Gemmatimonadales bacterium]